MRDNEPVVLVSQDGYATVPASDFGAELPEEVCGMGLSSLPPAQVGLSSWLVWCPYLWTDV